MTLAQGSAPAARPGDVFKLYSTCKLVKGGAFSAIYDLERRLLFRFETVYHDLFAAAATDGLNMGEIATFDARARENCLSAIAYLAERELGCFMDRVSSRYLIPQPERWDAPQPIVSSIVDVGQAELDWDTLAAALDKLQCVGLQVRGFGGELTPDYMEMILDRLHESTVSRIEILAKWSPQWDQVEWADVFERNRNLLRVRIHSAPAARRIGGRDSPFLVGRAVFFELEPIAGPAECGRITADTLLPPSPGLFTELRAHNGCLNRKVSIRADGQICNCPSLQSTYGKDLNKLHEIVASSAFQRAWHLKKDLFEVCSGCEFRYVCTDCRAHLGSDESLGKPALCGYDPASGSWGASSTTKALSGFSSGSASDDESLVSPL